ncbi:MAG: DUF2336 domain-containing protein [Alphaproteobacteria bacterium]|nr:MAG: DUF2336 domain-containing protein [Alphaproteobacteria bacterium]
MKDLIETASSEAKKEQDEKKLGPIGRGKSALMALLSMIEGSRERDAKTWIRIFETVMEFRHSENSGLEDNELVVLDVILHSLLPKIPVHHRRKFSDDLSRQDEASGILIESLITDELTVAAPLLARSKFITDDHFKAAITRGSAQHRRIIAGRCDLPSSAIDVLLESGDVEALSVLLHNSNIILSEKQFLRLLDNYLGNAAREKEILNGVHLTMQIAYQSYWRWLPSSRAKLLARYPVTAEAFGQVLDGFLKLRGEGNAAAQTLQATIALHDRLETVRGQGYTLVLGQTGLNQLVEFMLNGLCLGQRSIKRLLTDPSGLSLAIFFNAIGLRKGQFEDIYAHLFQRELEWSVYSHNLHRACESFDEIDTEVAANLVAIWSFGDAAAKSQDQQEQAA